MNYNNEGPHNYRDSGVLCVCFRDRFIIFSPLILFSVVISHTRADGERILFSWRGVEKRSSII